MAVKQLVETALEGLSEESLYEVLDFAAFMRTKETGTSWFDESPEWRAAYAESKADLQAGRSKEFDTVDGLMAELATSDEED